MNCTAPRHIAIWIDQHQAILLVFEAESLEQQVPHEPGSSWSQIRLEARAYRDVQQYHHAVLSHLEPQDEILILGPGWAIHDLHQHIEQHDGMKGKVVGLQPAAGPTQVELVCPINDAWRSEEAEPVRVQPLISTPFLGLSERSGIPV